MAVTDQDQVQSAKIDMEELANWIEHNGWEPIEMELAQFFKNPLSHEQSSLLSSRMQALLGRQGWTFLRFCLLHQNSLQEWTSSEALGPSFSELLPKLKNLSVSFGIQLERAEDFSLLGEQGATDAEVLEARDMEGRPRLLQITFDLLDGTQSSVRLRPETAILLLIELKRFADRHLQASNGPESTQIPKRVNGTTRSKQSQHQIGFINPTANKEGR